MPDFERIVLPEQRTDRAQSWTHLAIFGGLSLLAIAVLVNLVVADPTRKRLETLACGMRSGSTRSGS
jgi:hypothetical protein